MQINVLKLLQELRSQCDDVGARNESNALGVLICLHIKSPENALADIGRLLVKLGEKELGEALEKKYSDILEQRVANEA